MRLPVLMIWAGMRMKLLMYVLSSMRRTVAFSVLCFSRQRHSAATGARAGHEDRALVRIAVAFAVVCRWFSYSCLDL